MSASKIPDQTRSADASRFVDEVFAVGRLLKDSTTSRLDSLTGYEIAREIHRGGQGVVYEAMQKSTRRRVALKVMREGPFGGLADRARFDREIEILASLKHPNIVTIHDSGEAAGSYYFVMNYVEGEPLDRYMAGAQHSIDDTV